MGDQFTVADISVMTHFIGFELIANQTVDAERYPALSAYLQRLYVEPAVAKIIANVK